MNVVVYQLGRVRSSGPLDGAWLWFECGPPIASPPEAPGVDGDGNAIERAGEQLGRSLTTSVLDPADPTAALCVRAENVELFAAFATAPEVEVAVPPVLLRGYLARARAGETIGRHRIGEALPFKVLDRRPTPLQVGRPRDEELH